MSETLVPPTQALPSAELRRRARRGAALAVSVLDIATVVLVALIAINVDNASDFSLDRPSLGTFVAVLVAVRVGAVVVLTGLARQLGASPALLARMAAALPGADLALLWWLLRAQR